MNATDYSALTFSVFSDMYESTPSGHMTFKDLIYSTLYKDRVEAVRAESNPTKQEELKRHLPMWTPCGLFSHFGNEGLITFSGLISIDIDEKDNTHLEYFDELPAILTEKNYPLRDNILYIGHSCRGKGYFVLIPVPSQDYYKERFEAIRLDFSRLHIVIGEKCSDIGRRRFVSSDPVPYYNPRAKVYDRIIVPQNRTAYTPAPVTAPATATSTAERLNNLLSAIECTHTDITANTADWLTIGSALANEYGEAGREYFHRLSKNYVNGRKRYHASECNRVYTSLLRGKRKQYGIAIVFHIAKKFNIIS